MGSIVYVDSNILYINEIYLACKQWIESTILGSSSYILICSCTVYICVLKVVCVAYSVTTSRIYMYVHTIENTFVFELWENRFSNVIFAFNVWFRNVRYNNNEGGKVCYRVFGLEVYNIKLPPVWAINWYCLQLLRILDYW